MKRYKSPRKLLVLFLLLTAGVASSACYDEKVDPNPGDNYACGADSIQTVITPDGRSHPCVNGSYQGLRGN